MFNPDLVGGYTVIKQQIYRFQTDLLFGFKKNIAIFILFKIERENFMELKKSCQCKDISPLCQIESLAHLHNPFEVHGG